MTRRRTPPVLARRIRIAGASASRGASATQIASRNGSVATTRDTRSAPFDAVTSPPTPDIFSRGLSKFERTRLISFRAEALANGAKTTIPYASLEELPTSVVAIAEMEYTRGCIPLLIQRTCPNGRTVYIDPAQEARWRAKK